MVKVVYANAAKFGGPGIGSIAHQFARALLQAGHLEQVIAAYAADVAFPEHKLTTIPWMRIVSRLARDNHPVRDSIFDYMASRRIGPADIFHGWSSQSLRSLEKAKSIGAITFLERQNSHPRNQERLVQEEYDRWGYSERQPVRPRGMVRQLKEFVLADFITVPSHFAYESMVAEGVPSEKLFLVPYGVDLDRFQPSAEDRERFRFLFVGQVSLRKGIPYLLQAWRELALSDAELWLAGRVTPDAEHIVSRHRDDQTIKFLGHVADTSTIYRQASAFVFPTIEEGSALVTYEAMASGLPLIYTYNSGAVARDDIDGIEIPIRDVTSLSRAMLRLYDDQDLCIKMGHAGRRHVQQFSWEAAGQTLIAAYQKAAKNRQ